MPAGGWQCPRWDLALLTRVSVRSARGQVRQEGLQGQGTAAAAHPELGHHRGGVQDQTAHRLLQPDRWEWHRDGAGHSLTLHLSCTLIVTTPYSNLSLSWTRMG